MTKPTKNLAIVAIAMVVVAVESVVHRLTHLAWTHWISYAAIAAAPILLWGNPFGVPPRSQFKRHVHEGHERLRQQYIRERKRREEQHLK